MLRQLITNMTWVTLWSLPFISNSAFGQSADNVRLEECMDAQGHIVSDELRAASGWNLIRAFRWSIEVAGVDGSFSTVDPRSTFHSGQRFRVRVKALADLHVYVLAINADGSEVVLLPQRFEEPASMKRGETISLPADGGALRFAPPAGNERIRLIATRDPLPWVAGRELFKLQSGQELTEQERQTLEQLKSIRTRSLQSELQRQQKLPTAVSLTEAIMQIRHGVIERASEVLLVEPNARDTTVGFATADAKSAALMVHDVVLEHRE